MGARTGPVSGHGRDAGAGGLALIRELLLRLPAAVAYVAVPDLVFEFANEEYRRIVGGRELVGLALREALPELARERLGMVERAALTGQPSQGREAEVWIRRHGHESEQLFVDFAHQPVRDEAGRVVGVLMCGHDVTAHVRDRRRLEVLAGRLATTDERYRTLFETLPYGVIHYNADGSVLGANPAASEILGLTAEEITTRPPERARHLVHEDGSPYQPDELPEMAALRGGRIVADAVVGLPHGRASQVRWLLVTAVPDAMDERGTPQRAYAMFTDITEQRRAEAALRESNRLLGRLRDANVIGVVVLTEQGVQEANDAYLDIIGYTRGELEAGQIHWQAITPAEWAATDNDALAQLRQNGVSRPWEKEYVHRDGHRVPVMIGAAMIDPNPLRWASFVVDLTARQRREQERAMLLAREQAARAEAETARERLAVLNAELEERVRQRTFELVRAEQDRLKLQTELGQAERLQMVGQLTSGVAHDFGNLLGVIVGYAQMAEELGGQDPELHRILSEIHGAAGRAEHLSGDLLRFSRRAQARPEVIDLNALITGARDLLTVSLSGNAEVLFEMSPAAPAVLADREQLEQVLLNLAVNARDAMPEGGTLTISTSQANFGVSCSRLGPGTGPGRYAELAIRDTGAGMSLDVRDRIFERFFTTKPAGKGTGLGLSTVHGIVTGAGGFIEVDTREGHGTTFRIYLPAAPSPAPGVPQPA